MSFNRHTHTHPRPNPLKFNTVSQKTSRVVQTPYFDYTIPITKASEVPIGNREPRKKSSRNLKSTSSEVMRLEHGRRLKAPTHAHYAHSCGNVKLYLPQLFIITWPDVTIPGAGNERCGITFSLSALSGISAQSCSDFRLV